MSLSRAAWRQVIVLVVLADLISRVPLVGSTTAFGLATLDGLWPLWDYENRALHDMLAGTRVKMSGST